MANAYKNKVVYGGNVLIDLTDTTATAEDVANGKYFYDASGKKTAGTARGGSVIVSEVPDSHGGTVVNVIADEDHTFRLQTKTIVPSSTSQTVSPDNGYDGFSSVVVEAGSGSEPLLQTKTVTPTESVQTIEPDFGYDGLSAVEVDAISSTYIGSNVTRRSTSDLSVSDATVNVPEGYYTESTSKTILSGSASTPATNITANPSITVDSSGLITSTTSASKSITPSVSAGYVTSGTAGTVSISGSNTEQLNTQAAVTITPTTSEQTAVAAGKFTTGPVKVAAMPSGTAGTPVATKGTVSSNHSISITPSVTNTTGYITGSTKTGAAVTVTVSELESGTKTITENGTGISVSGYASVDIAVPIPAFVTYYTGSSVPSSSLGSDGDIYLQT